MKSHDYINAGIFYGKAVKYIKYTDPGAASQVYLNYGDFLADTGDTVRAAEMYRKGLDLSETSGNMEYRQQLLGHMADLAYGAGDWEATLIILFCADSGWDLSARTDAESLR